MSSLMFRPPEGWVGDVIPYYWDGQYWLFYLHDGRSGQRDAGTSWHLACTSDFVTFRYQGEVLPHGTEAEQDLHAYTGSIIESGGTHHLFYTGYNPRFRDPATGHPRQAVMHAVSTDLISWKKLPADTFYASGSYDVRDWRDPFVYRTPGGDGYTMLLAAQTTRGPSRRRGCVARALSADLRSWTVAEPLWAPSRFITHECPDLFRIGDWWYLVYSEFSEKFMVRYRMSRSPAGPWLAPADDSMDGRAFYAAKTAGNGERRYAFGWIPTRQGLSDTGSWEWGGDLVVHQVTQRADGTLAVRMPDSWRSALTSPESLNPVPVLGRWQVQDGVINCTTWDSLATIRLGDLPARCRLGLDVKFAGGTRECGLVLRGSADCDEGYYIRLEPGLSRVVFDRWPRGRSGPHQWQIGGDLSHAVELERHLELPAGTTHHLDLLIDDTACVAYIDDTVAMTVRMYDRRDGCLGLFAGDGDVQFPGITLSTR